MYFVFSLIFMFPIDFNVSNRRCFQCMFPISLLSYWTITNEEILQYYETHAKHTKRPYFCAKWFVLASLVQSGRSKRVKMDGPWSVRSSESGRSWVKVNGHSTKSVRSFGWIEGSKWTVQKCQSGRSKSVKVDGPKIFWNPRCTLIAPKLHPTPKWNYPIPKCTDPNPKCTDPLTLSAPYPSVQWP